MVILGIESTAHTASVGLVDGEAKVLAISSDMYRPPSGGIHPREAANHHVDLLPGLVEKALAAGGVSPREIDAVAFAQGPGLGPCLRAGATVARMLALAWDRPLIPVNHCVAHVEIARILSGFDDPMLLYASGGNTQVIAYARGRYRSSGRPSTSGSATSSTSSGSSSAGRSPAAPPSRRRRWGGPSSTRYRTPCTGWTSRSRG